jgi:hypothetical protein
MKARKSTTLKSALGAANRGWRVIPLHWIQQGRCSCERPDCSSAGKHPLVTHGIHDGTIERAKIREWWAKWPDANIGVLTGKNSGIAVLDIDARHGGLESLRHLEEKHGQLPDCPRVRTGNGLHFYFSCPADGLRSRTGLLSGIDLRADGAYVVAPISKHVSGKLYQYVYGRTPEKISLPSIPGWLLQLMQPQTPSHSQSEFRIPQGRRNSTLTSLAGTMRARSMSQDAIEAALLAENATRCDPPLSNSEVIGIAQSIARYSPGATEFLSFSNKDAVEKERKKLTFRTGLQIANETPAEVPWIISPYVAAGAITEIDGKVKLAGKTTFVTHFVNAVLDGSPFLDQPTKKTNVVYLSEQPIVTFRAAMARAGLLGRKDFTVLFWAESMGTPWPVIAEAAIEKCKQVGAKMLVIDTLPQFAGLVGESENNAGDALKALMPLQKAAAEGIAVVIVRHERKSGGAVSDSGRGSSAFAGGVDVILLLRRPPGNHPRNVRQIESVSRFENSDDLLIELTDAGYRSLGPASDAAKNQAAADLLSAIPKSKKKAATIEQLIEATGRSRVYVQGLLDKLMKAGEISRSGEGHKGSPFKYYKN